MKRQIELANYAVALILGTIAISLCSFFMEPICEAKFSENSYGFRPMRSIENAMSRVQNLMHWSNLHYVVEFDIKEFFDNVNHPKLLRQI